MSVETNNQAIITLSSGGEDSSFPAFAIALLIIVPLLISVVVVVVAITVCFHRKHLKKR